MRHRQMASPLLSIITVNLNNRDGLQKTIDSVISQTFTDYEWIVIDGGSTDGSKELIEQYADRFAYWCSEPDKGIYNAMNKGIAHAKGEWLLFINSGDWLSEREVLNTVFSQQLSGDIIYGNYYHCYGQKQVPVEYNSELSFLTIYYTAIPHPSSFIKRTILEQRPYNEDYIIVSDWEFFIDCALKGKKFSHIDIFVSCYDNNGVSSSNRAKVLEERSTIIDRLVPRCIQKDMEQLDKLNVAFSDGQLSEIDALRKKNRFMHRIVTFDIWVLRLIDKIFFRKKEKNEE